MSAPEPVMISPKRFEPVDFSIVLLPSPKSIFELLDEVLSFNLTESSLTPEMKEPL